MPKDQSKNENQSEKIIECPDGTVPIMRNTEEYVTNAQYWAQKHFNPLTIDRPGTHIAGVRAQHRGPYHGVAAWMSVHDLSISADQTSYTNIFVGSGLSDKVNFIQTGWMVNPSLFGDGRTWSYGFWQGANGSGCYNTVCRGFIQVSKTDPLSAFFPYPRKGERAMHTSILQDRKTGNWWRTDEKDKDCKIYIGYWPRELFDFMSTNADMVGVIGAVQASPSGKSPPMGNGHLPTKSETESARVKGFEIIDSKYKVRLQKDMPEKLLDSAKCYGLRRGLKLFFKRQTTLFKYGGPGGDFCGI